MASKITGVSAPRIQVSPGLMMGMAGIMGVVEKILPVLGDYTAEYLRVISGVTYLGDNSRARSRLGCNLRPLEQGLRDTLLLEMMLLGMPTPTRQAQ